MIFLLLNQYLSWFPIFLLYFDLQYSVLWLLLSFTLFLHFLHFLILYGIFQTFWSKLVEFFWIVLVCVRQVSAVFILTILLLGLLSLYLQTISHHILLRFLFFVLLSFDFIQGRYFFLWPCLFFFAFRGISFLFYFVYDFSHLQFSKLDFIFMIIPATACLWVDDVQIFGGQ